MMGISRVGMATIEVPQIIICDTYTTDMYRLRIKDAVDYAGYFPRIFTYAEGATQNLSADEEVTRALITHVDSINPPKRSQAWRSLFNTALRLDIPTLILADDVDIPVKPDNVYDRDIVLPSADREAIAPMIADWLSSLRPQSRVGHLPSTSPSTPPPALRRVA